MWLSNRKKRIKKICFFFFFKQIVNSDVNYAAVSFASVLPARRSNNRHLAEYSEVNYKQREHSLFTK